MEKCKKCNIQMKVDPTRVLLSMPPQPVYYCPECDKSNHERVEQFNRLNTCGTGMDSQKCQDRKLFDPRPEWVIEEYDGFKNMHKSLPLSANCTPVFFSSITGSDLLIKNKSDRVIFIGFCDITDTKKIIESDVRCVVIFFNNKSDKWWQRFGFCFG